jgi:hypothetical protein
MHTQTDPGTVYMRTQRGQVVALARDNAFPRPEMMVVLRLVNGYTPAATLEALVSGRIPDAHALLQDLEARGLIEQVPVQRPMRAPRELAPH